jgi:type II restriction enzyme
MGNGSQLFLVAPDNRREEVALQLRRPAFTHVAKLGIRYLSYGQIKEHSSAIQRFGAGIKPLIEISPQLI